MVRGASRQSQRGLDAATCRLLFLLSLDSRRFRNAYASLVYLLVSVKGKLDEMQELAVPLSFPFWSYRNPFFSYLVDFLAC